MPIGFIWQTLLETPLVNFLVALTVLCFGSYGLAILLFTVITRVITFPLTLRTLHSMRALQEIQPQLQEVQKKYSDPRRRSEETMKLYREHGVNPLGCLGPQLIQIPLFIALYQVVRITLGNTPEGVLVLSHRLYDVDFIQHAIPLQRDFLFMDLGENGGLPLALVVFAGMWLQQRISAGRNRASATSSSAQQQQMTQMMQWIMPIMFSWFVLAVPSGVGLYWAASTIIGLVLQWIFVGPGDFTWGSLIPSRFRGPSLQTAHAVSGASSGASGTTDVQSDEVRDTDAGSGSQRQNRRRGRSQGARSPGPENRTGRRRRHPRG